MSIKQKIIVALSLSFIMYGPAYATVYFYEDSESRTCNSGAPWYWENYQGYYSCDGDAFKGSKYLKWYIPQNGLSGYIGIDLTGVTGNNTYYMAAYFKIQRINGQNVHMNNGNQSMDKFFEFSGTPGIRWVYMLGEHESGCQTTYNGPNSFTAYVNNEGQHFNPAIECVGQIIQNASGYSNSNPYQISYDQWHSAVMEVKMASNNTGWVRQYIDGVKIIEYMNIRTMGTGGTAQITSIKLNGTIAQPAYNAPEHYRMFDNIILTDNLQDIVDGGYLGRVRVPSPPVLRSVE